MKVSKVGDNLVYAAWCESCPTRNVEVLGPCARSANGARDLARQAGWLIASEDVERCHDCAVLLSQEADLPTPRFRGGILVRGDAENIASDLVASMSPFELDALVDMLDAIRGQSIAPTWHPVAVLLPKFA